MTHSFETDDVAEIIVRACKYDGTEHRRWQARVLQNEAGLLVLDANFDQDIDHALLGRIARGTLSVEYYWMERWYNVFRFSEPTGELRNYYCNVNMPPVFDGRVLSFVDLDVDVLVAPNLSFQILDQDEFDNNALRYNYPPEVQTRARLAIVELVTLIESRAFPFDQQA